MALVSTPARYGVVAQLLHWLTAGCVLAAYLLGEGGPESRVFGPENAVRLVWHETFGALVLLLLALRLLWRLVDHVPQRAKMPAWMTFLSRLAQIALLFLLALVPLTAILASWYGEHPLMLVAIGEIAPQVLPAPAFSQALFAVHTTLADVILILAGMHAAAALFRHFVFRDRVLISMLPFGRIPSTHLAVPARSDSDGGRHA